MGQDAVGSPVSSCGWLCALGQRLGRAGAWVRESAWLYGPALFLLTLVAVGYCFGLAVEESTREPLRAVRNDDPLLTLGTSPRITVPVVTEPVAGRVSFGAAGAMQPYTGTLSGGLDGWKIDRRGRVYDERGYFRGGDRASLLPQAHDGGWCPTTLRLYQQTLHTVDGEYCWRCSWWVDTLDGVWRFTRTDPMRLERVPPVGQPSRGAWTAARMEDEMRWVDGEWQVWRCR